MKLAYSLTSSIIFFIIATIAFIAMKYTMTAKTPDSNDSSWMVQAGYVFVTLLAQLIINFSKPNKSDLQYLDVKKRAIRMLWKSI